MLLLLLLRRHHRRVRRFRRGLHGLHTVAPGFTTTISCRSPTLAPLASLNIHCQLLQVTVSLARMSDDPIAGRKFVPGFAASPRLRPLGLSHFHSQPSPTTRTLTLSFVVVIFTSRPRQKKQRLRASEGPSLETLAHSLAACPAPPPWPRPSCSCRSPPFLLPGCWGTKLGCWRQVNIPREGEERWRRRERRELPKNLVQPCSSSRRSSAAHPATRPAEECRPVR